MKQTDSIDHSPVRPLASTAPTRLVAAEGGSRHSVRDGCPNARSAYFNNRLAALAFDFVIAHGVTRSTLFAVLTAVLFSPASVKACSACMGGADTSVAPAMNGAIFLMLGLVGLMLSSVAGFIFYLSRRARALQADLIFAREGKQHA